MRRLESLSSGADWLAVATILLVVFGILIATGNLTTGPRLSDDNHIYKLQIEFEESSFFRVLANELSGRFEMNRLAPVYSVQKVIQSKVFGGNLVAWSIWVGLIGVLTAWLLFWFFRLGQWSTLQALVFALISVLGEQSVLWWRLLHGEGIGMLLLSAALVLMALRSRTGKRRYELAFSLMVTLSGLSKKSIVLTVPAILFLKVWLTCRLNGVAVRDALKQSLFSIVWLTVVFVAVLLTIKLVFGTTQFLYAGWTSFDGDRFVRIMGQYLEVTNRWLSVILLLILIWCHRVRRVRPPGIPEPGVAPSRGTAASRPKLGGSLVMALVFWTALTLP